MGNRDWYPMNLPPTDLHHHLSNREGSAESNYRVAGIPDRFPHFSNRLLSVRLPYNLKPSNYTKYDGKTEPNQCLRIYSQSIELVGGDSVLKVVYFPMALEPVPLAWFDRLQPGSIDNWDDLQRKFCKISM